MAWPARMPSPMSLSTAIDTPRLGFEVIQPTFGPSHYKENYRNLVGEGMHHMNASRLPDAAG